MITCDLSTDQASIIQHCLAERRDAVIRRMDTYRRMGDVLASELYDQLILIGHSELELLLDATSKLKGNDDV